MKKKRKAGSRKSKRSLLLSKHEQKAVDKEIVKEIRRISNAYGDCQKALTFLVGPEKRIIFRQLIDKVQSSPNLVLISWDERLRTVTVCSSKSQTNFSCKDLFCV